MSEYWADWIIRRR